MIAGAGELGSLARDAPRSIEWLGHVSRERVLALMRDAAFLVLPSEWYEGFPMTLVEAFGTGLAVLGSRLGAIQGLVADGKTGLQFAPGDDADLAARATWAFDHPAEVEAMGRCARAEFDRVYSPERNYEMLMSIYVAALTRARA
jgi:glycosyltransferase involved in cell wall biosynthesis